MNKLLLDPNSGVTVLDVSAAVGNVFNNEVAIQSIKSDKAAWGRLKKEAPRRLIPMINAKNKNVFVEKAYEDKTINEEEYKNMLSLHKRTDKLWEPEGYIYLRSNPEQCFNRIKKRARDAEKNIKLEYIKRIHELHEDKYCEALKNNKNIICIDVESKSIADICSEIISSTVYSNLIHFKLK